jgi:hypothetical protein
MGKPSFSLDANVDLAAKIDGEISKGECQPPHLRGGKAIGIEKLLECRAGNVGVDQFNVGLACELHLGAS